VNVEINFIVRTPSLSPVKWLQTLSHH